MSPDYSLRLAHPDDQAAVSRLLATSYPRLLAADYDPAMLDRVLPVIVTARPELLASGRYYVVVCDDGQIVGAGGYSLDDPAGGGEGPRSLGHIRHVATDPDHLRQGIAAGIMAQVFRAAAAEGVQAFDCLSTRTAVSFYAAQGFRVVEEKALPLGPGIAFPVVFMRRE